MAERSPRDDRDLNLQEESTKINPELCDDGDVQEPQVKGSAASSSAITEANKKTDASSSLRNRETGEIRRADKEKDRNDDDDGDKPMESDNESDLCKINPEIDGFYDRFLGLSDHREEADYRDIQIDQETCRLNQIARSGQTTNPQQQLTRSNRGSTSSTSDRKIISQLSPKASPFKPQNPHRPDSETSLVMKPPGEDAGSGSLVTQPTHQNPRLDQIVRSGTTTNPQQELRGPNHGSTSSTSDRTNISQIIGMQSQLSPKASPFKPQNPHRSDSETCLVMKPPGEYAGSGSLVTQPTHQNPRLDQIVRSGPTTNPQQQLRGPNHGSTSSTSDRTNISQTIGMQSQLSPKASPFKPQNPHRSDSETSLVMKPPGEDAGSGSLVTQPTHQNPRLDQIVRSGPTTNPQQQLRGPNHGSTSSTSDRTNISQTIGMQSQLSPKASPFKPQNPHRSDSETSLVMKPPGEDAGSGSLVTQPTHQNPRLDHIVRSVPTTNPQQQLRGPNHGSTSFTSDRTNISQTIGMQSQLSPRAAAWRPQNTYQQHPVANQMSNLAPRQTMMPMPTQILQGVPETQQQRQSQGFNARPSSEQGQDQQQPM